MNISTYFQTTILKCAMRTTIIGSLFNSISFCICKMREHSIGFTL
jgi:hypothetical protein